MLASVSTAKISGWRDQCTTCVKYCKAAVVRLPVTSRTVFTGSGHQMQILPRLLMITVQAYKASVVKCLCILNLLSLISILYLLLWKKYIQQMK